MLNPGDPVGPYVIRRYLGSSSIGAGYEVEHADLGTQHCLTLLPESSSSVPIELSDQLGLTHRNLLTVTGLLHIGGHMAILTEFFAGRPLGDMLSNRELDLERRLEVFYEIIQGVGAAHHAGVLHLDLRPGNVLVGGSMDNPIVKVAFFRLAKLLRDSNSHAAIATTRFVAPEVMVPGISIDPTADVFSLGAMLYEMVSGRHAFSGNAPASVRSKTMGKYTPLIEVANIPEAMSEMVDRALSPRPVDRYQTVEEMGLALFGQPFMIYPAERREVHYGTARPAGTRSDAPPPERTIGPTPEDVPEDDEEGPATPVPPVVLKGGIAVAALGVVCAGVLSTIGVASVATHSSAAKAASSNARDSAAICLSHVKATEHLINRETGGDRGKIVAYERALQGAKPERRVSVGYRLCREIDSQLEASQVPDNPELVAVRVRMSQDIDRALAGYDTYVNAVADWHEATTSPGGLLVVSLGLASTPTPDQRAMLEISN